MKQSFKNLTILLVALLASNLIKAANYTYTSSGWSGGSTPILTSSDSVTITSGTWTLSANTTVKGIRLAGGNLNLSTRTLTGRVTIGSNATLTSGSGSSITSYLVITSGTLTLAGGNASVGDLIFKGGNLALATFNITVNNSTVVSSAATISSQDTSLIDNTGNDLSIKGGTLTLNNVEFLTDNLIFASSTTHKVREINGGFLSFDNSTQHTLTNVGNSNHVFATVRLYTKNGNTNSFTFPTGDSTIYAPIKLAPGTVGTTGTAAKYFQVKYVGSKNSNTSINTSTIKGVSGSEYWILTNDATNPSATVTLLYNVNTVNKTGKTALTDTSNIRVDLKIANISSGTWDRLTSNANNSPSNGVYSIISSGAITPSGTFSIGSSNTRTSFLTPLPVSIIDFSAKATENNIEVKWSTASEKNNANFIVEKSLDGKNWSAIGNIKGAQTSNVVNNYGLVDYKPSMGMQYYRLKQVDLDGTISISKAIAVNFSKAVSINVNLFPNPAKDILNINSDNNASGEISVQIVSSMGEMVYNQTLNAGSNQTIDIASYIPGIYYVTVISEGESKIFRLLKN